MIFWSSYKKNISRHPVNQPRTNSRRQVGTFTTMGTLAIFFALYLQRKSQRTFEPNQTLLNSVDCAKKKNARFVILYEDCLWYTYVWLCVTVNVTRATMTISKKMLCLSSEYLLEFSKWFSNFWSYLIIYVGLKPSVVKYSGKKDRQGGVEDTDISSPCSGSVFDLCSRIRILVNKSDPDFGWIESFIKKLKALFVEML